MARRRRAAKSKTQHGKYVTFNGGAERLERRQLLSAITFAAQQTYASGSSPRSVAVADLGNGNPDVVVTNDSGSDLSVFIGNGDGTFQPQTTYATGELPISVAIADLGNGHPDLVTANTSDDTVSVLLGNGNGTFQAQTTYAVGTSPEAVAIADLGNGHPDLVVANAGDNTVSVLLGNGDGTFQPQQTFAAGNFPDGLALANLGNGHIDIVTATSPNSSSGSVTVLLGNGDGTFGAPTSYTTGVGPSSVAIGDLGNGHPDIVTSNLQDNTLSVLLGNGDGTFQAQSTIAAGSFPIYVAIADLGNGKPDLVVANSVDNNVGVYLGNGNGTFGTPTTFATGSDPISVAVDNLGNGLPDIVVANADTDTIGVLINDTPNQLAFTAQPQGTTTTATLAPVSVDVLNPAGTQIAGDQFSATIAIASGPTGATLGGTTTESSASGVATFSNLTLTTAGTYTLKVTDLNSFEGSDTPVTSSSFTITVPAANKLAFAQQPVSTTTNSALAPVKVDVESSTGTLLTGDTSNVTLAIASGPSGATLGGTATVAAAAGVATFSNLTFATAGTYTLTATDGSDTAATSTSFTITASAANKLVFAQEPVSTTTTATLGPVKIDIETSAGALLTSDTSNVTLAIATGPAGATLGGTATVAAAAGVATFSNLTLTTAGTYTLTATDGTDTAATSTSFTITVPAANKLSFAQEPVSTTTTATLSPVKIDVENSAGALLNSDTSNVTIAIATGPTGATLGGTPTVAAVAGVATFSNLALTTAGAYTLTATDGSDSAATSTSFTITVAGINKLAYAQEPVAAIAGATLGPVKIDVENSAGALLTTDTSTVNLAIASGPAGAALGGTTAVAAIGGVATFSTLSLATPGNYTLTATDGTDTSVTSVSFTIAAPAANKLVVAAQPVSTTSASTLAPVTIDIENSAGTLLSTDTSTVTLAIASGPHGAALGGTASVAAVGGVATFSNLTFATAGSYTLIATDGADTSATSVSFTISPPLANKLAFAMEPADTVASSDLNTIKVEVENNSGTLLTTDGSDVTLTIATGSAGATLGGTTTVTAVNGIATFSGLFIITPGANYTLTASDGTDVPETSSAFTVTAPATHNLTFSQQPVNTSLAGTLGTVVVDIEDSSGAIVTTDSNNVTLAISGTPAGVALSGTTTVAAVNGVATFTNITINTVGNYALTATEISEAPAVSAAFTVYYPPVTVGQLDPAFGVGGLVKSNVGFTATAGVAQDGTQAVVIGTTGTAPDESFAVARYNADGSLDHGFGANGVVSVHFAGTDDVPAAVVVNSAGQIIIAGTAYTYVDGSATTSEFAVAEFNSNGTVDTSFGNGTGQMMFGFSTAATHDVLHAMAAGPNGIIYLGGTSDSRSTTGDDFAVMALTSTGAYETSFGAGGQLLVDFEGGADVINSLAVQTNGDLIAAGSATVSGVIEVGLARILPTGILDRRFGIKGLVTTSVRGVYDSASSVAIQPRGQIVIGGESAIGSGASLSTDFLVIRYTAAGRIDRSFGGGEVVTSFSEPSAVTQVIVQSDGAIIASGKTTATLSGAVSNELDLAVARYTTRGVLDASFDGSGRTVINLSAATFTTTDSHTAIDPLDTSTLEGELDQFIDSKQGVATSTTGGDILDVGNSGDSTVEAEIITEGVDLSAMILSPVPGAIAGGTRATAIVQVAESGVDIARGSVTIQLEVATDTQGNGEVTVDTAAEKINLLSGRGHSYRIAFVYPATLGTGHYYLLANVLTGTTPALRDLNQANNLSPAGTSVVISPPFVSLTGSGLATASAFTVGKVARILFTLANDGNVLARGQTTASVYLSTDQTIANGTPVPTKPFAVVLQPGKSRLYRFSFALPATVPAGSYYLIAVIDPIDSLGTIDHTSSTVIDPTQVTVS